MAISLELYGYAHYYIGKSRYPLEMLQSPVLSSIVIFEKNNLALQP
jgi:hypothetical protein